MMRFDQTLHGMPAQPFAPVREAPLINYQERESVAQALTMWRRAMHRRGWIPYAHVGAEMHRRVCFGDIEDARLNG